MRDETFTNSSIKKRCCLSHWMHSVEREIKYCPSELVKFWFFIYFQTFCVRRHFKLFEMAKFSVLERKINKHMKESTDQINLFKDELKTLKCTPTPRMSFREMPTKEIPKCKAPIKPATTSKNEKASAASNKDDSKPSRKAVTIVKFNDQRCQILMNFFSDCPTSSERQRNESSKSSLDCQLIRHAKLRHGLGDDANQTERKLNENQLQSAAITSISVYGFEDEAEVFRSRW